MSAKKRAPDVTEIRVKRNLNTFDFSSHPRYVLLRTIFFFSSLVSLFWYIEFIVFISIIIEKKNIKTKTIRRSRRVSLLFLICANTRPFVQLVVSSSFSSFYSDYLLFISLFINYYRDCTREQDNKTKARIADQARFQSLRVVYCTKKNISLSRCLLYPNGICDNYRLNSE